MALMADLPAELAARIVELVYASGYQIWRRRPGRYQKLAPWAYVHTHVWTTYGKQLKAARPLSVFGQQWKDEEDRIIEQIERNRDRQFEQRPLLKRGIISGPDRIW